MTHELPTMTTNTTELQGHAMREAAARAMGWKPTAGDPVLTIDAMLDWLHERGEVKTHSGRGACNVHHRHKRDRMNRFEEGTNMGNALARLVAAVADAEAK